MARGAGVEIVNLREFRRDLKRAQGAAPRALSKGLREAGKPVLSRVQALAPSRTGRLRASYRIRVRGTTGNIDSVVPYGAGAEYGRRGKWKGFLRYGPAGGRFAWRAVEERTPEIMAIIERELRDVVSIQGWAR